MPLYSRAERKKDVKTMSVEQNPKKGGREELYLIIGMTNSVSFLPKLLLVDIEQGRDSTPAQPVLDLSRIRNFNT